MKVSIVIPVYNEAATLGACLRAIARQTVWPLEVIVVDNNSTDATAAIAAAFDFVRVIKEPRQGVAYARTTGFDAARGAIIGRIDADTVLPPDWVEQVAAIFRDSNIAAVTGQPDYYDFPLRRLANVIDRACRRWLSRKLADSHYLYGSNMALRRQAWRQVRSHLCPPRAGMHEDFDVGIHLQQRGFHIVYDEQLSAAVCSRRIDTSFRDYARYTLVSPRTYALHRLKSGRHMYRVVLICWLCYLPGRLLYRAFDSRTGNYSWQQLLTLREARVDPTVDVA